jgi:hypothetical protein
VQRFLCFCFSLPPPPPPPPPSPPPPTTTGADPNALSQEASPPLEYPSITQAWTGLVAG